MKKLIPIRKVGGAIVKKYFSGGDFDFDKTERDAMIDRSDELFDRPDLPTSNNNYFSDNLQRQMINTRRRNNIRTARYDAAARKVGLNTTEDIIAWQRANGLEADGLFGAKSQALWNRLHGVKQKPARNKSVSNTPVNNTPSQKVSDGSMLRIDTPSQKVSDGSMLRIDTPYAPIYDYNTPKDYMDAFVREQNAKPNKYAGYHASVLSVIAEDNRKKANEYANNAIKESRRFGDITKRKQAARNTRAYRIEQRRSSII